MPRTNEKLTEEQLKRWKIMPAFLESLHGQMAKAGKLDASWADPKRQLEMGQYLGLFLFGLFNPVVRTMRGLCAASDLRRVQEEVSGGHVSLGSFSEAQALVKPDLLKAVFESLSSRQHPQARPLAGLKGTDFLVIDSTVWQVVARMGWAFWRPKTNARGGPDNAVRLHMHFELERQQPSCAQLTEAKYSERAHWSETAKKGACYIADSYYGRDYQLLGRLQKRGVNFLVRLAKDAQWVVIEQERLSEADTQARVGWAGKVRLGVNGDGALLRVIEIKGENEPVILATTLDAQALPPELAGAIYRQRWQVEMFFRWIKCILGCRHWLAESKQGVSLKVYLALIAAQLLVLYGGARPNRRQMEAIQWHMLGWASAEEAAQLIARHTKKKR